MQFPEYYRAPSAGRWRAADLLLLAILTVLMIAISAHAPSHTYSYAQYWQIHASIDHLNGGSWVLPKIDADGEPAHKPQLYAWMLTPAMQLTGLRGEVIFRFPTMLAALATIWLTYLLGVRWYGRLAGLTGAALLLTSIKMNKLVFLATTDMLLVAWITWCVFCMDRLLFHYQKSPEEPYESTFSINATSFEAVKRRWWWLVGFWGGMIAAMITKGWGVVNLAILGGIAGLMCTVGPGFSEIREKGWGRLPALLLKRWWGCMKGVQLWWGLLAMAAVAVPLWIAMLDVGGEKFRETVHYELVQRLTGEGADAPESVKGPAIAHLYYILLPCSIFAGCALFLSPLKKWLNYASPIALPLGWIIIVLVAFGVPAGFRPDYLAPCFPAVGLLAGWATVELTRPERYSGKWTLHLRRICQITPFVIAAGCIVLPCLYIFHQFLPESWREGIALPAVIPVGTWDIFYILPIVGLAMIGLSILAVRKRRLSLSAAACCIGMLGVLFVNDHTFSRHARTGDGETMWRFSQAAAETIGGDSAIIYNVKKAGIEAAASRFLPSLDLSPEKAVAMLGSDERPKWLMTNDVGLLHLGAYEETPEGAYKLKINGEKKRFVTYPQQIGRLAWKSSRPVKFEKWGTLYLIELTGTPHPQNPPFITGWLSNPVR